jgi:hypothetical protein
MSLVAGGALVLPTTVAQDLVDVQERLETMVERGGRCVGGAAASTSCPRTHELAVAGADLVTIENSPYRPRWGSTCQVEPEATEPEPCEFGVPRDEARHRIALVGDSHAGHWAAALDEVAQQERWNVVMQVKSSCAIVAGDWRASWATEAMTASCRAWGQQVSDALVADDSIELVVVSAISRSYLTDDPDRGVSQLRAQWREWVDAGKNVMVLGDPPDLDLGSLPECLGTTSQTVDPCAAPRAVATPDPLILAARGQDGVVSWSPLAHLCDGARCHSVVGGLPVYGDQSHLLQYFARTLAPALRREIVPVLDGRSDESTAAQSGR